MNRESSKPSTISKVLQTDTTCQSPRNGNVTLIMPFADFAKLVDDLDIRISKHDLNAFDSFRIIVRAIDRTGVMDAPISELATALESVAGCQDGNSNSHENKTPV